MYRASQTRWSAFLSTINKNPRSWITAIVGAEYIFNILPKGTHEFKKFIKPSELACYVRNANAELIETKGMFYNPITHKANLNNDLGVNYLMYARKSNIKLVLFDLDGTLIDTAPDFITSLNNVLSKYNKKKLSPSEIKTHISEDHQN